MLYEIENIFIYVYNIVWRQDIEFLVLQFLFLTMIHLLLLGLSLIEDEPVMMDMHQDEEEPVNPTPISNKNDSMVIMEQDENIKQKLDTLQTAINDNDDDDEKQTSLTMTIQQRNMEIAHLQRFKEQDSTPPPTLTIFHVTDHKAKQQGTNNDDNYDDSDHDDHDVDSLKSDGGNANEWIFQNRRRSVAYVLLLSLLSCFKCRHP